MTQRTDQRGFFHKNFKDVDQWWLLVAAVVLLVIILITAKPDPYNRILRFVSDGIWVTFYTTGISFILVLVLGLVGGLGRTSRNPLIRGIAQYLCGSCPGDTPAGPIDHLVFCFPRFPQGYWQSLEY